MKTVEQVILTKPDGDTVTICKVDLCRTAPNQYLVNNQQGPAGGTPSEGSEPPLSVAKCEQNNMEDTFRQSAVFRAECH